jgi:hypothetical protein
MAVKRATLLQDVSDLLDLFEPRLRVILAYYQQETNITQEEVMRWIVCEELAEVYGLFDPTHNSRSRVHRYIYDYLSAMLPFPPGIYISQYLAAPKIYPDDNSIEVILRGRDLFIRYYSRSGELRPTFLRIR